MNTNNNKWMRIFTISETAKHKKGFTIYKVISLLYPENCPDAITKITVWKRFNDFKKLHAEVKLLQKKFNIKDKFPILASGTFFNRFDEEVVRERKQSILIFLEYVASHHSLFTSTEFVKFFETSHTPHSQLSSKISSIRADLQLPEDPEFLSNLSDDEDCGISDTDSITTVNSLQLSDFVPPPDLIFTTKLKKSCNSNKSSDTSSVTTVTDSLMLLDGTLFPTPPNTPGSNNNENEQQYVQYILDATIHINIANELELNKKHDEAFTAYKTAIDILLKHAKDDPNYDRKQLVRYKTEKYLLKAEKIYNMYLAPEIRHLQEIDENIQEEPSVITVQCPVSDLYKYRVVRVISKGMLVLHSELQQLFYIKVIHKTTKFSESHLILPDNTVPYMIKLHNYYDCEDALFLVLEYCSGLRLWDYVKAKSENPDELSYNHNFYYQQIVENFELSDDDTDDNESESSFTDLINNYKLNKNALKVVNNEEDRDDGDFEEVNVKDFKQINDAAGTNSNINNKKKDLKETNQRKYSEMSSFDETLLEDDNGTIKNFLIPLEEVVKWAAQLLLALEKLHAMNVICRDLQSRNLLVDEHGDLKLTYMCNINEVYDIFTAEESVHLAPELYSYETVTSSVDWWSYGAILYELLVGMPLSLLHPEGLSSHSSLRIPKYVSPEGRSLLKQLLVYEPQDRLGFGRNGTENLKSHPFFNSIDWDEYFKI